MRLTISLDADLYAWVKARGKREDRSMSAVINALLRGVKEPAREGEGTPLAGIASRWPTWEGEVTRAPPAKPISTLEHEAEVASLERRG